MPALILSSLITLFLFNSYGILFYRISTASLTERLFLGFTAALTLLTKHSKIC